ncbi:MAG TPA: nucleotide kinase domain-containing protein [Propionibacteriaceae bacterium]|nr:nucleotide kinase domain-containing protein [Propionibacteriaceae bacterium]
MASRPSIRALTPRVVTVAGHRLRPTPVFDTYWRFAVARQQVYEARLRGDSPPWTNDPIMASHRFTNCYRAADRVSQYLISHVIYSGNQDPDEVLFRILLFKFFNRVSTWELLRAVLGDLAWRTFAFERYDQILTDAVSRREPIYSAAYVIPSPRLGAQRKHTNHLRLLQQMLRDGLRYRLQASGSMSEAFQLLRRYPGLGDFLAYQLIIDINYSTLINFDEMDFVVAGPGARDGICKCFGPAARGIEAEIIRYMSDAQSEHFARLGLNFFRLYGRRLQLIDCQNLFCEVDKYARVAHPEIGGYSGRTRIKQRYVPSDHVLTSWFPPKWGLNASVERSASERPAQLVDGTHQRAGCGA